MWIFWIFFANAGIMWLEYVYRNGSYTNFWSALPYIIVPIIIGQLGLFNGFRSAPSLMFAGAMFTLINIFLRIVNSLILGEVPNAYNWLGVFFLVVSLFLLKVR